MKPYYSENGIEIYHGDCMDILPKLSGIDCCITSPPYNTLPQSTNDSGMHGKRKSGNVNKFIERSIGSYFDAMSEKEYQKFVKNIIGLCLNISPVVWVNHKTRYRDKVGIHPLSFLDFPFFCEIIWDANSQMAFNSRRYVPCHEYIFGFGYPKYWNKALDNKLSIWDIRYDSSTTKHPCSFPLELPTRLLISSCPPNGAALDPFMGSGTTLLAAKNLGRHCVGIEKEEKYCEIAVKRLQQEVLPFKEVKRCEQLTL